MNRFVWIRVAVPCLMGVALMVATSHPLHAQQELGNKALEILKKHCTFCHGPGGTNQGGFDYVLDHAKLLERQKFTPGDVAKSLKRGILKSISSGDMPPQDQTTDKVAPEELEILKQWVAAGAPAWGASKTQRKYVSLPEQFAAIRDYQLKMDRQDRRFIRYYSLAHLHNNPQIENRELRMYRAALSKLVNSLSWKAALVIPQPIDAEKTVFAIDLRKLDWDRHNLWNEILKRYPYGVNYGYGNDRNFAELCKQVYEQCGTDLPMVRADWFVVAAALPDLYYTLLRLPKTGRELEYILNVDFEANFNRDQMARSGFSKSGVSSQNRLLERHEGKYGFYWRSYDFKSKDGKASLFQNPLGPHFRNNPYNHLAFEEDGGEMIFSLPNGLQGYYLVDGKDRRIDEGPIDVVSDGAKISGSNKIVNALSCMWCHKHGMISEFTDGVRDGSAAVGAAREKVYRLYPKQEVMNELMKGDRDRFMQAFERSCRHILCEEEDKDKSMDQFNDPVGTMARIYINADVNLEVAAFELHLADPNILKGAILGSDRLRELGLRPLANGQTLKRDTWESMLRLNSIYQEAASALDLGAPKTIR